MDGEVVTYTCKNSVYRFRQDGAEKEDWKDSFDVECGWENKWNPPEVYGCVDIRGCSEPPPRYIHIKNFFLVFRYDRLKNDPIWEFHLIRSKTKWV